MKTPSSSVSSSSPVVVLDAANVSTLVRGTVRVGRLQSAINHFEELGIRCIAFAPAYWVKGKTLTPRGGGRMQQSAEMELDQKAEMLLVQQLVAAEKVVLTPPQAHDDLFIIDYAIKHNGFVVTNDMFRDHVANKTLFHGKELTEAWVKAHCMTFTFVGTEFLPSSHHMTLLLKPQQPTSSSQSSVATTHRNTILKQPTQPPKMSPQMTKTMGSSKDNQARVAALTINTSMRSGSSSSLHSGYDSDARVEQPTKAQTPSSSSGKKQPMAAFRKKSSDSTSSSVSPVEAHAARVTNHDTNNHPAAPRAKTPQSKPSTPQRPTKEKPPTNIYKSLDNDDSNGPSGSNSDNDDDEKGRGTKVNVLEEWKILQSMIAQHQATSGNNQSPVLSPAVSPRRKAIESTNQDEDDAVDVKAPLSPSQKKRLRRRLTNQKKVPAMVYRGKQLALAVVGVGVPLLVGLVLNVVFSRAKGSAQGP
ncbi:Aste57867_5853 [Aphanomyces stellatus]|uniref:Aste57867_5853 protein n=1 Tax=Aphanomyces stellatus TaxID=120398 RepID=A0A485KHL6_9STRA|nr:hypothetical protein As57867_005839 [Aphanomyces stellatus]VFT82876.1 Aste57867_5853 [Aphanomyces stellatus]